MILLVVIFPKFPLEFCGSDEFGSMGFFYQLFYFNVSITLARCRYYSGWTMAQSGLDATGFSYGGVRKDGSFIWDNILNADPTLELLSSPKEKIDKWNSSVAFWLRRYVYLRIYSEEEIKKKPSKGVIAQNGKIILFFTYFIKSFLFKI